MSTTCEQFESLIAHVVAPVFLEPSCVPDTIQEAPIVLVEYRLHELLLQIDIISVKLQHVMVQGGLNQVVATQIRLALLVYIWWIVFSIIFRSLFILVGKPLQRKPCHLSCYPSFMQMKLLFQAAKAEH